MSKVRRHGLVFNLMVDNRPHHFFQVMTLNILNNDACMVQTSLMTDPLYIQNSVNRTSANVIILC